MRLLYIHQHFSTPRGSAGTRSFELAQRMIARGHEVVMVCGSYRAGQTGIEGPFRRGSRRGIVHGIEVIEFDLAYHNGDGFIRRAMIFARFALRSTALALVERYDVIFATTTPLTAALPGLAARWLRGKRFVFEVRDLWPELPRAMGAIRNRWVLCALSALEWCSYRSAHRLVGLAPGIVDGIANRGVDRERIALVPNGCDLDLFAADVAPTRPDGVDPSVLFAVFTGTHGMANGLDAVLDAAVDLRRRNRHDICLGLIGDGAQKAALQERARMEGLANVIFVDPVGKHDLACLLAGADVGMQILADVPAFYFGTSPNKFFDYIAAGLPVLNNYPGWLAAMIDEYYIGWAVRPRDAVAFADALVEAAGNRAMLKTMGKNAQALARSSFDRDKLAAVWVEWIEGVQEC